MDRLDALQTFIRVVDTGSFSLAAERMNTAKSSVSRRIADLEAHLGVRLLNRTTRSLGLTESGRTLYQRALRLVADLEEVEATVSTQAAALKGSLRVAAPSPSVCFTWGPRSMILPRGIRMSACSSTSTIGWSIWWRKALIWRGGSRDWRTRPSSRVC